MHVRLPTPHCIVNVKQYRLPRGYEEITATVKELERVRVIRHSHSNYNSPVWLLKKPNRTWRMTVDDSQLNKVVPPIHLAGPNNATILEYLCDENVLLYA